MGHDLGPPLHELLTRHAHVLSFAGWLSIAGALYLDLDVVAAALLGIQGVALALDAGGVATRTSRVRRCQELYSGQYSTTMLRVGGAVIVVLALYWLYTLVL